MASARMSIFNTLRIWAALAASLTVVVLAEAPAWAQPMLRLERPEDSARVKWPVEVSGQAPPSARIRISVDGQVKATLRVGPEGRFAHKITGLPPKQDTLRITVVQLDERDQVQEQASVEVRLGLGPPMKSAAPTPTSPVDPPSDKETPAAAPDQDAPTPEKPQQVESETQTPKTQAPERQTPPSPSTDTADSTQARRGAGVVPRLISQGLFSALIGGAGAAVGGVVSWRFTQHKLGEDSIVEPFAIAAGAYLGGALLLPLGMYTGGELGQGQGSLLWTYVGGVTATGSAIYLAKRPWVDTTPALAMLLILPPLGAWAGYELSRASEDGGADAQLQLIPTIDGARATFMMRW